MQVQEVDVLIQQRQRNRSDLTPVPRSTTHSLTHCASTSHSFIHFRMDAEMRCSAVSENQSVIISIRCRSGASEEVFLYLASFSLSFETPAQACVPTLQTCQALRLGLVKQGSAMPPPPRQPASISSFSRVKASLLLSPPQRTSEAPFFQFFLKSPFRKSTPELERIQCLDLILPFLHTLLSNFLFSAKAVCGCTPRTPQEGRLWLLGRGRRSINIFICLAELYLVWAEDTGV